MRLLSLLTLGLALSLTLAACDSADPGVSDGLSTLPLDGTTANSSHKSDVCHYDADADTYHLINIADAAFDQHIAHGDAAPGDAVPTQEGYFFDGECVPRRAVEITALSCPTTLEVDEVGAFAATLNDAYGEVSSEYDFGDGSTAEGTEASHAFSEAETYVVTFTATGPFNSDTETCSVDVTEAVNSALGDLVFEDLNENGIRDAGEVGLGGVTVRLLDGSGTNVVETTTTDASGNYLFGALPSGEYVIEFGTIAGAPFTAQNVGADDTIDSDAGSDGRTGVITLSSGEEDLTWDAGVTPPYDFYVTVRCFVIPSDGDASDIDCSVSIPNYYEGRVTSAEYTLVVDGITRDSGDLATDLNEDGYTGVIRFETGSFTYTFEGHVETDNGKTASFSESGSYQAP